MGWLSSGSLSDYQSPHFHHQSPRLAVGDRICPQGLAAPRLGHVPRDDYQSPHFARAPWPLRFYICSSAAGAGRAGEGEELDTT
jgi:hypothetical protein